MDDALRELALQLLTVPGAPHKLLDDYFPGIRVLAPDGLALESWQLPSGRRLDLNEARGGAPYLALGEAAAPLLTLPMPQRLAQIAHQAPTPVPALTLALAALAMGLADGDKALAAHEPRLVKSAKELLLIAACRLCG